MRRRLTNLNTKCLETLIQEYPMVRERANQFQTEGNETSQHVAGRHNVSNIFQRFQVRIHTEDIISTSSFFKETLCTRLLRNGGFQQKLNGNIELASQI
jgi:hypothetical protein